MKLFSHIPSRFPTTALTIGTFDGLHLGHQAIFTRLQELRSQHTTLLTFTNHPREILSPPAPPLILSRNHKLDLLKTAGLDALIELPFTPEFASLSYEELLSRFSLTHLILGKGAAFGKAKKGTEEAVSAYAKKRNFRAEYLPLVEQEGAPISSTRIRAAIQKADFSQAAALLGRPYGFYFFTDASPENHFLLPPDGNYPIRIDLERQVLGITTTPQGRQLTLSRPATATLFVTFED